MKRIVKSDTIAKSQKYNTKYIPGVTVECIGTILNNSEEIIYTKKRHYEIQSDYTIVNDKGDKILFTKSRLFKERAFTIVKPRYFLVSYAYRTANSVGTSACNVSISNGKYINNKELIEELKKILNFKVTSIVITNIIELSEEDYNEFKRE